MTSIDATINDPSEARKSLALWKCGFVLALVGLGIGLCYVLSPATAQPEAGVTLDLPKSLLYYSGEKGEVSQAELTLLPKDTQFAKMNYPLALNGAQLNAQIVLGGTDRRSIHRPEVCLPGQGWTIASTEEMPVTMTNGKQLMVKKLILSKPIMVGSEKRNLKLVFAYWFVSREFTTPDHIHRILSDAWDMLFHNKLHRWAYVIVSAPVLGDFMSGEKDEKQTVEFVKEAIGELAPQIMISEGATPK